MPVVPPDLAARRRRLLRRHLADTGLCVAEVAVAIGCDPDYLAKLVAGSRPITDAMCWQLQHRASVPFSLLEEPPLYRGLGPGKQEQLERDLATVR